MESRERSRCSVPQLMVWNGSEEWWTLTTSTASGSAPTGALPAPESTSAGGLARGAEIFERAGSSDEKEITSTSGGGEDEDDAGRALRDAVLDEVKHGDAIGAAPRPRAARSRSICLLLHANARRVARITHGVVPAARAADSTHISPAARGRFASLHPLARGEGVVTSAYIAVQTLPRGLSEALGARRAVETSRDALDTSRERR
eukprot:scaffold11187_cov30-Tisochrysis_lutea.AAC.14